MNVPIHIQEKHYILSDTAQEQDIIVQPGTTTEIIHHLSHAQQIIRIYAQKDSIVRYIIYIQGDSNITLQVHCILEGNGASISVHGAYAITGKGALQIKTTQHHKASDTKSNVMCHGIIKDQAHISYHGLIRIEQDASKSVAYQKNKTISLSSQSRVQSVPSLEVLTDDVQCAHGTAIGSLDEPMVWYMMSRGIPIKRAHSCMIQGFFTEYMLYDQSDHAKLALGSFLKSLED